MAVTLRFTGDREVRARLKALGSKLRRTIVVKAMAEAMGPMLDRAQSEAPEDTGNLESQIHLEVKGEQRGKMLAQVVVRRVRYAPAVELGAPNRDREADPFLTRAFDAEGNQAVNRALSNIADGIERGARS